MKTRDEVRREWIAALRSGEYEQGRGELRVNGRFCCLGLVCDLNWKDGGGEWTKLPHEHADIYEYMDSRGYLPPEIRRWLGITTATQTDLVSMNDAQGMSFAQIADWLEKKFFGKPKKA